MPHRKLVKIGESPKLPTIQEFFTQMADRQREEIQKLKSEIAGHPRTGENTSHPVDPRMPVPDPWLLHPVRIKRAPPKKKPAKKKAIARKPAAKKSTAKRKPVVKKASPKKSGAKKKRK